MKKILSFKAFILILLHNFAYARISTVLGRSARGVATALSRGFTQPFVPKRGLRHPAMLNGFYNNLPAQLKPFSPMHGIGGSAYVSLFYDNPDRYVNESTLAQNLFYRVSSNAPLLPTVLKSGPFCYLDPHVHGIIAAGMATDKLEHSDFEHTLISTWRHTAQIKSQSNFTKKKIAEAFTRIKESYRQSPLSTRMLLLGHLYHGAEDEQALQEYVHVLKTHSSIGTSQSESLQNSQEREKNSLEHKEYIESLPTERQIDYVMEKGYENTMISAALYNYSQGLMPPLAKQQIPYFAGFKTQPDCAEVTYRNFLNTLLFNPNTRAFDLSLLPKSACLNSDLVAFYTQNQPTLKELNFLQTANAFMKLVASRKGVAYVNVEGRVAYELKACAMEQNVIALSNLLFGLQARSLKELGNMLSTPARRLVLSSRKGAKDDYLGEEETIITFQSVPTENKENTRSELTVLELVAQTRHAYARIPKVESANSTGLSAAAVQEMVHALLTTGDIRIGALLPLSTSPGLAFSEKKMKESALDAVPSPMLRERIFLGHHIASKAGWQTCNSFVTSLAPAILAAAPSESSLLFSSARGRDAHSRIAGELFASSAWNTQALLPFITSSPHSLSAALDLAHEPRSVGQTQAHDVTAQLLKHPLSQDALTSGLISAASYNRADIVQTLIGHPQMQALKDTKLGKETYAKAFAASVCSKAPVVNDILWNHIERYYKVSKFSYICSLVKKGTLSWAQAFKALWI